MSRVRDIANILSGGSSAIATDAEIPPQVSGKNKVINSDFRLNSLGFSSITSTFSSNNSRMMVDRWQSQIAGSDSTIYSLQAFSGTDTPSDVGKELKNYMRVAVTGSSASGSGTAMYTRIEDSRTLADEVITVSFWARASSGTPKIAFDIFRNYGPGGSSTDVGIGQTTFTLSTAWTRYTSTFTMPSVAGKTITDGSNWGPAFWFSGASDTTNRTGTVGVQTATIDICAIQVEKGSVATAYSTFTENPQSEIIAAGSNGNFIDNAGNGQYAFGNEGVLVSTNAGASININKWAGYQVAGKNKIINGDFSIWQRGTSFSPTGPTTYTADRFYTYWDGTGSRTISRQAFAPGAAPVAGYEGQFFYRHQQTTSGQGGTYAAIIGQYIEDVRTFAGQTVTLSFWAKADASRNYAYFIDQSFGSGGSAGVTVAALTVSMTTFWQRFSFTFNVPSISGKTIGTNSVLNVRMDTTVNNITQTVDIWGIQLEAGSVATPFTTATGNPQAELTACQRYYQRFNADGSAYTYFGIGTAHTTSSIYFTNFLKTTMRTVPTTFETSGVSTFFAENNQPTFVNGLTAILLPANVSSRDTIMIEVQKASAFTSGMFYRLVANGNGNSYIAVGAEL